MAADTTQITAAKQTRLVIHSSKRKSRTLYMGVSWNCSFSATAGCDFLGETRKAVLNASDRKIQKTAIIVDKKNKPKTKLEPESPQTAQDTKIEKPQFLSTETEKPNQKLARSAKPKIPTRLLEVETLADKLEKLWITSSRSTFNEPSPRVSNRKETSSLEIALVYTSKLL